MTKNNIIFYVPRTSVLNSFIDPINIFLRRKFNVYIFHADSLYNSTSAEKPYNKIDIGKMSLNKITHTVKAINPVVFFCIHFASINDKLMIRLMKKLNIKTYYLQHGLLLEDQLFYVKNDSYFRNNFFFLLYRNSYFIRNYLIYICTLSFNRKEFHISYNMFFRKIFLENTFEKAIFFTNESYEMVNKYFHFRRDQVKISGSPLFYRNDELIKYNENPPVIKQKYILYVHSPFVFSGSTHLTYITEREYLKPYFDFFIEEGYVVKFLLHPREEIFLYTDLYKEISNIEIIQEPNSVYLLHDATFVLGHSSSVLINALCLRVPIIQIPYPGKYECVPIIEEHSLFINSPLELKQTFREKEKIKDFIHTVKHNNDLPIKITSFEHIADLLIEII